MLHEIWLWFLWWAQKNNFIKVLNNKVWFSYPDWAWVTESRALRVLNLVWKAVWMIGQVSDDKNIKEFQTLAWAKLAFTELKSTWKVWALELIDDDVKVILEVKWFIDPETKELNVWKFINEL